MSAKQRVVLLTGAAPQHCRVARTLALTGRLDAIVIDEGLPLSRVERLRTGSRRFGVAGLAQRLAWKSLRTVTGALAREHAAMQAILGDPVMPDGVETTRVHGVNAEATRESLARLAPDVLCIYGTSIVKDATLSLARSIALNMHTGISPQYRGADCAFWPLYEGKPQWLGATVHECTSAIDGGAIYGTVRASLEASDGVGAVFGRCVVAGAELYRSVLSDVLDGSATPYSQDLRTGREYRAAMRSWRAELRVEVALRRGLVRDFVAAGQQFDASGRSGD